MMRSVDLVAGKARAWMRSYVVALDFGVAVSDFVDSRSAASTVGDIATLGVSVNCTCPKRLVRSKIVVSTTREHCLQNM